MKPEEEPKLRAPLRVRMEGPAVRHHRLALQDLVLFAQQLQTAVDRVGRVLLGQSASAQPGRKPSEIKAACSLDIVDIAPGSLTLVCDLPLERQMPMFVDLGEETLVAFVAGISSLSGKHPELPKGYDKGVLLALREGGKLLDHGIHRVEYHLQTRSGDWKASYTPQVHRDIVARIQGPVENQRAMEGRLLMGDFKETGFRCRIHPPIGRPVPCTFDEDQKDAILTAMTRYVRVVGESTEVDGEIQGLKVEDIEILDGRAEAEDWEGKSRQSFYAAQDLEMLAVQQGVSPVTDFDKLLGDFWPEDESVDEFNATIRGWRDEDSRRRAS